MAPPSYADIGKQARDVFGKGYHFGLVKLEVKSKSANGIEFTAGGNSTIYRDKMSNFPFQDKPELYIGGIFPITGSKYKAPELAKGIC